MLKSGSRLLRDSELENNILLNDIQGYKQKCYGGKYHKGEGNKWEMRGGGYFLKKYTPVIGKEQN